jgi:hypothetical protein
MSAGGAKLQPYESRQSEMTQAPGPTPYVLGLLIVHPSLRLLS